MDRLSKEQRHKNMAAVKSKGTKIETILGQLMWHNGIRYRKNDKSVFGHPDFVMKKRKIAIFCDGEMWHGKDWEQQKKEFFDLYYGKNIFGSEQKNKEKFFL